MKFINYLNELYIGRAKATGYEGKIGRIPSYEVFVNPSLKEINQAGGSDHAVRFVADFKNKKLYVFSVDCIHNDFFENMKRLDVSADLSYCSIGIADIEDGKLEFDSVEQGRIRKDDKWARLDDKWLNTWFKSSYIKMYREATE